MTEKTINLFFFVSFGTALFYGFTGRVDWFVIILIFLSHIEVGLKLRDKK